MGKEKEGGGGKSNREIGRKRRRGIRVEAEEETMFLFIH